jgi:hypothetical protein
VKISLSEGEKAGITITKGEIEEVRVLGGWCFSRPDLDFKKGRQ